MKIAIRGFQKQKLVNLRNPVLGNHTFAGPRHIIVRSNSMELMNTLKVIVLQGISFMCQKENILIWTIAIAQISYSEHVRYAQTNQNILQILIANSKLGILVCVRFTIIFCIR